MLCNANSKILLWGIVVRCITVSIRWIYSSELTNCLVFTHAIFSSQMETFCNIWKFFQHLTFFSCKIVEQAEQAEHGILLAHLLCITQKDYFDWNFRKIFFTHFVYFLFSVPLSVQRWIYFSHLVELNTNYKIVR